MASLGELLKRLIHKMDPTYDTTKLLTTDELMEGVIDCYEPIDPSIYKVKGSVTNAQLSALTNQEVGDVYNITDAGTYPAGSNVVWNGTEWDKLSETVDLSAIYTALDGKQGTLTAGTGISIDADNVISATGGGGGDDGWSEFFFYPNMTYEDIGVKDENDYVHPFFSLSSEWIVSANVGGYEFYDAIKVVIYPVDGTDVFVHTVNMPFEFVWEAGKCEWNELCSLRVPFGLWGTTQDNGGGSICSSDQGIQARTFFCESVPIESSTDSDYLGVFPICCFNGTFIDSSDNATSFSIGYNTYGYNFDGATEDNMSLYYTIYYAYRTYDEQTDTWESHLDETKMAHPETNPRNIRVFYKLNPNYGN